MLHLADLATDCFRLRSHLDHHLIKPSSRGLLKLSQPLGFGVGDLGVSRIGQGTHPGSKTNKPATCPNDQKCHLFAPKMVNLQSLYDERPLGPEKYCRRYPKDIFPAAIGD